MLNDDNFWTLNVKSALRGSSSSLLGESFPSFQCFLFVRRFHIRLLGTKTIIKTVCSTGTYNARHARTVIILIRRIWISFPTGEAARTESRRALKLRVHFLHLFAYNFRNFKSVNAPRLPPEREREREREGLVIPRAITSDFFRKLRNTVSSSLDSRLSCNAKWNIARITLSSWRETWTYRRLS